MPELPGLLDLRRASGGRTDSCVGGFELPKRVHRSLQVSRDSSIFSLRNCNLNSRSSRPGPLPLLSVSRLRWILTPHCPSPVLQTGVRLVRAHPPKRCVSRFVSCACVPAHPWLKGACGGLICARKMHASSLNLLENHSRYRRLGLRCGGVSLHGLMINRSDSAMVCREDVSRACMKLLCALGIKAPTTFLYAVNTLTAPSKANSWLEQTKRHE